MRWFLVKRTDVYRPQIILPYNIQKQLEIKQRKISAIENAVIWHVAESDFTFFSDILTEPVVLFSAKAKEAFKIFNKKILYKRIVLIGNKTKEVMLYYAPILPIVEGKTVENKKIKISQNDVRILDEVPMLNLKMNEQIHLLANLEIIESFLRKQMTGVHLEYVELSNLGGNRSI